MKSQLVFLVAAKRCEIRDLEQLALNCELVQAVSRLVHLLQRERGATRLAIAAGDSRFDAQRAEYIAASRVAEDDVRARLDELATESGALRFNARLCTRIAIALDALDGLPDLRGVGSAAEVTPRYGVIIGALLALVFEAADIAADPDVSKLLVSMFNLMQGKELAGQERAAGAVALAAGHIDADRQQALAGLIEAQEQCFKRFVDFGAEDGVKQWRALQTLMPLSEIERMRRILLSSPASTGLDRALAETWFDCCSRRLDLMHRAEVYLAATLKNECSRRVTATRAELEDQERLLVALSASVRAESLPGMTDAIRAEARDADDPRRAAGVALGPQLTRSIVDTMQAQARRLQQISDELATVRAALDERKLVERAKGLLMAHHGAGEDQAYQLLRQTAMNQGRRVVDVARTLLEMALLLPPRT